MNSLVILLSLVCFAHSGIIHHEEALDHGIEHHERATSYQNIHMEHFHPVPTYIKKQDKHYQQFLEHPISLGASSSKLEVHHGGKHDHGYAFASAENNAHGHGFEGFDESIGGHEIGNYQVQDQGGNEYSQYQGQSGQEEQNLGHYSESGGYSEHK